jgi:hypothetical protein
MGFPNLQTGSFLPFLDLLNEPTFRPARKLGKIIQDLQLGKLLSRESTLLSQYFRH